MLVLPRFAEFAAAAAAAVETELTAATYRVSWNSALDCNVIAVARLARTKPLLVAALKAAAVTCEGVPWICSVWETPADAAAAALTTAVWKAAPCTNER